MTLLPLAHASHWYISMLYLAPVVILVGALAIARVRDKRLDDDEQDAVFHEGAFDDDL